jgi:hypothetical protein
MTTIIEITYEDGITVVIPTALGDDELLLGNPGLVDTLVGLFHPITEEGSD